jgi:hypothetical protein
MRFARLSLILTFLIAQSGCQLIALWPRSAQSASNTSSQQKHHTKRPRPEAKTGPQYDAYSKDVRQHWVSDDYAWLESEAWKLRKAKERLPGGYWKLRVLYDSIEGTVDSDSSDESYKEHIERVEKWITQRSGCVMARILLADAWLSYAWKARGTDYASKVERENWLLFKERLRRANEVLAEAFSLQEKCPELYVTALMTSLGNGGDRQAFEELFEQGVAREPTYYYLYNAKAMYLLPQWYGEAGEWERFAEDSANKVGGEQGDIILFAVYTRMMQLQNNNVEFMQKHQAIAPRLLEGFKAIDKLYGSSPQRLNQACFISFSSDDNTTPAELMKRIGDDSDLSVWRDASTFNVFRQEALMRIGELPRYRNPAAGQKP